MKKSFSAFLFLLILFTNNLLAQENENHSFFDKADHIYLQSSFSYADFQGPSMLEFIYLNPSLLSTLALSSFKSFPGPALSISIMSSLGFDLGKAERSSFLRQSELKIGLGFRQAYLVRDKMYLNEKYRIDTLYSLVSGEEIPIDSTVNKVYRLFYVTRGLQVSIEWLLRSNTKNWISFFAGVGMSSAYQFANNIYIRYDQNSRIEGYFDARSSYINNNLGYHTITSKLPARSSLSVTLFMPLGFQLRLRQKSKEKEAVYFYYEASPGWSYARIPERSRNLNSFSLGHSLGLRVSMP